MKNMIINEDVVDVMSVGDIEQKIKILLGYTVKFMKINLVLRTFIGDVKFYF
jgi:hypothetical protein